MKRIALCLFGFVVMVLFGCELEMVADDTSVTDDVDVATDITVDIVEVDVATDTITAAGCEQFTGYWQCFCQAGLCSGDLWKTIMPCEQGNCAVVTDVTEVDSVVYQTNCLDIGQVKDGVLFISTGEETYLCVPAESP